MNSTTNTHDRSRSQARKKVLPSRPTDVSDSQATMNTGETIGALLVQEGHITQKQLIHAKRVRSKLATPRSLLNVLQDLDFITDEQLQQTLRKHQASIRLGDLLVELGFLREVELEAALKLQKKAEVRKKLGQILIENRFLSESKLADVLAYQLGLEHIEPHFTQLDRALLNKGTVKLYRQHCFIPIAIQDGHIVVAFHDPLDTAAREAAEQLFGRAITPAIATAQAIQEALDLFERSSHDVKGAAQYDESTVVGIVNSLLLEALQEKASDIHIEPMPDRLRVRFRCDGVLVPHKDFRPDVAPSISSRIKILAGADIAEKRRHQGGRILFEDQQSGITIDLRVSFYVTIHGEKIVLRLLNKRGQLLNLQEIGMVPKMLERFRDEALDTPSGVVVITGPTGSGKTTTLYSCINYLNDAHTSIITAEDPVEYIVDGISQCSINPKINVTFEETLRHIVRQDPDVIVLGEVRDRFSAETAIQAALTGHKVLTTFHTEDSIGGLLRLMNMEIEAFLISSTVVSVLAQRLLRRVCSNCAEPYTPAPMELRRLGYENHALRGANLRQGRGCPQCRYTGYRGRISVFELLVLNELVKDAILNHRTSYEIRRISIETSGLVALIEDGIVKASQGHTTLEEAIRHLPRLHKPRPLRELQQLSGVDQ